MAGRNSALRRWQATSWVCELKGLDPKISAFDRPQGDRHIGAPKRCSVRRVSEQLDLVLASQLVERIVAGLHDVHVVYVTDGRQFHHQIANDKIDAPKGTRLILHYGCLELLKRPSESAVQLQG